jgi:hypothetical protein
MNRWFLVFGVLLSQAAVAQVPAFFDPPAFEARRKLVATRVEPGTAVVIDGELTEPAWALAQASGDFVQREPQQGKPATHRSTVRLLFDANAVYIAAELEQPPGGWSFNQRNMRRDFETNECDHFSILLDTLGDGRNAFVFSVNPFGAQRDAQIIDDDEDLIEPNWDTLWRTATKRTADGWTLEVEIPWKSLRFGPKGTVWGIQFFRRERGRNEDTVWSPIPRTVTAARMPYAGIIDGLEPPPPSLLSLQLRPYVTGRLERLGQSAPTLAPSAGGEVTWNPTSNSVLDLTLNTDFAETDVDRRVVNLSRFNVFFPERRQFFLESAGVFSAGFQGFIQPFFSRRIGLVEGRAVPITGGARFVYRSEQRSAGALAVHTLATRTENSSVFALGRYSHNLGTQSRVGGMVVGRHDFEGPAGEATTNVVPVLDGLYRNGPLTASAMVMGSSTTRASSGGSYGGATTMSVTLQGNWGNVAASAFGITRDFQARTGFIARPDILGVQSNGGLDLRPSWLPSWLRNFGPFYDGYVLWSASTTRFQEANIFFAPWWMQFSGGDEAFLFVEKTQQVLTEPFAPVRRVSFDPGEYSYQRFGVQFLTQASRKVFVEADASGGSFYSANRFGSRIRASLQPIPHISTGVTYQYNRFWGNGVTGPFADTHLLLLEARLALNPRLQVIGSYQRDTDGNATVLNARLAWEFLPLSFLYIVVTDTRTAFAVPDAAPSEFRVIAKVAYTWRP